MQNIVRIIYLPTLACNCNCAHCGEQRSMLETECSCDVIGQRILESHCFEGGFLSVSGGEPFLKQGLPDMLALLCNAGKWTLDITTNGICTEPIQEFCNKVHDISSNRVSFSVSIDGMPEVHNCIRQNAQAFKRATETLQFLQSVGAQVKINTVIQKANIESLDEFASYIQECSGAPISWIPEILEVNGRNEFPYTEDEAKRLFNRITDPIGKVYLETSGAAKIKNCHAGLQTIVVDPSGKVYACLTGAFYKENARRSDYYIGDLNNQSLDEIFTCCQDEKAPYRRAVSQCCGCWNPCEVSNEINFWGMDVNRFSLEEKSPINFRTQELNNEEPDSEKLEHLCDEAIRINSAAISAKSQATLNEEPGSNIRTSPSHPVFVQKIFTFFKRIVRKATRFLVLDQKKYNKGMSECVAALCESQERVLQLTKALIVLSAGQKKSQMLAQDQIRGISEQCVAMASQAGKYTEEIRLEVQAQIKSLEEAVQKFQRSMNDHLSRQVGAEQELKEELSILTIKNEEINKQVDEIARQSSLLHLKIDELNKQKDMIYSQIEGFNKESDLLRTQVDDLNRQGDMFSASVAKTILEYRKDSGLPVETSPTRDSVDRQEEDNLYTVLDYFKFQNHFRGTRALITERQKIYLPYFIHSTEVVLDIGCGRGEFLRLMKDNRIPALGIDVYPEYVVEGALNGLNIQQGDGIAFLKNTDQYFGGIFVCQVIEHISFIQLQELCAAAYDRLVRGAYLILETPNPGCLSIFANAFYVDPTHNKPVHPLTLQYLLEEVGFENVKIEYTPCSKLQPLPQIQSEEIKNLDQVNEGIVRVSDILFGSQDYAVIARKPEH